MFIKISTGKESKPIEISKKQTIKELKELIEENFNIEAPKQKLFFAGKLLDDNTPIYKYDVKDGYVIQCIESAGVVPETKVEKPNREKKNKDVQEQTLSEYYKLGEFVEVQDDDGSWYEAEITEMSQDINKENADENSKEPPAIIYKVYYKKNNQDIEKEVKLEEFRPRSIHSFDMNNLKIRQTFHVNYNLDNPMAWGKWYDFHIDEIDRRRRVSVIGKILLKDGKTKDDVKLELSNFEGSIFAIEKHIKISERDKNFDVGAKPIFCDKCKKNRTIKCKACGCSVCGGREEPEKTIVCDECQWGFHIFCLKPPLKEIPEEDDWYCKECKNQDEIVKAGDTVKTKRGSTADKTKSSRYEVFC